MHRLYSTTPELGWLAVALSLAYLQGKSFSHNDLKPDNVLMLEAYKRKLICDLGCASGPGIPGDSGDSCYMPPEAWKSEDGIVFVDSLANPPGDGGGVWSMGVALFEILSGGKLPFLYIVCSREAVNNEELSIKLGKSIREEDLQFDEHLTGTSKEVCDLIRQMCTKNPAARPSAADVLKHAWFHCGANSSFPLNGLDSIRFRRTECAAQMFLLNGLAMKLRREHHELAWKIFEQADTSKSGTLDAEEFQAAYQDLTLRRQEDTVVRSVSAFNRADINSDGQVDFTELLAFTFDWVSLKPDVLRCHMSSLIDAIDTDDIGFLDKQKLENVFHGALSQKELERTVGQTDMDGDGKISLDELKAWLIGEFGGSPRRSSSGSRRSPAASKELELHGFTESVQ